MFRTAAEVQSQGNSEAPVSPGALAEAALRVPSAAHTHAACEEAGAVRNELSLLEVSGVKGVAGVGHLLRAFLFQSPLAHDEGVVDRQAVDLIDALRLDGLVMLQYFF